MIFILRQHYKLIRIESFILIYSIFKLNLCKNFKTYKLISFFIYSDDSNYIVFVKYLRFSCNAVCDYLLYVIHYNSFLGFVKTFPSIFWIFVATLQIAWA